ncbi:MAG: GNAT family N-acetyltransferase [Nitrososphaerales archaeon]
MTWGLAKSRDLELNEIGWWSHWADVRWTGETSYVMLSSDFDEYFFNRAGFVDCAGGPDAIPKIEAEFEVLERPSCFSVQEECGELADVLESRGYATFDGMSVMQLDRPDFKTASGLKVLSGPEVVTAEWAAAYSLSFYGGLGMKDPVSLIADRLGMEPSATLFVAERDGNTMGVLAAFRTPGLLGVYCVGTLGIHRSIGIAGSLIHEASRMAATEGRLLILQTIASENVEGFYAKRGFHRLYQKKLMRREASGLNTRRRQ